MNRVGAFILGGIAATALGGFIALVVLVAWGISSADHAIDTSYSSPDSDESEFTVSQCQSIVTDQDLQDLGFDPDSSSVNKESSSCRWENDEGQSLTVTANDSSYYTDVAVGERSDALTRFTEACTSARYGLPTEINPGWLGLPEASTGCVSANNNADYGSGMFIQVLDDSDLGREFQIDIRSYVYEGSKPDVATWRAPAARIAKAAREAL